MIYINCIKQLNFLLDIDFFLSLSLFGRNGLLKYFYVNSVLQRVKAYIPYISPETWLSFEVIQKLLSLRQERTIKILFT
jgi:hypothetical protein